MKFVWYEYFWFDTSIRWCYIQTIFFQHFVLWSFDFFDIIVFSSNMFEYKAQILQPVNHVLIKFIPIFPGWFLWTSGLFY